MHAFRTRLENTGKHGCHSKEACRTVVHYERLLPPVNKEGRVDAGLACEAEWTALQACKASLCAWPCCVRERRIDGHMPWKGPQSIFFSALPYGFAHDKRSWPEWPVPIPDSMSYAGMSRRRCRGGCSVSGVWL